MGVESRTLTSRNRSSGGIRVMTVAYDIIGGEIDSFESLRKTISTAGTAERVSSIHIFCREAVFVALHGQDGNVCVGGSNVDATTENGLLGDTGEQFTIELEGGRGGLLHQGRDALPWRRLGVERW